MSPVDEAESLLRRAEVQRIAGRGAGSVAEPDSFAAAELFARFHLAQKAPYPVHLLVVCRAELLEAGSEFPGWFAALCGLLLDLIEKAI